MYITFYKTVHCIKSVGLSGDSSIIEEFALGLPCFFVSKENQNVRLGSPLFFPKFNTSSVSAKTWVYTQSFRYWSELILTFDRFPTLRPRSVGQLLVLVIVITEAKYGITVECDMWQTSAQCPKNVLIHRVRASGVKYSNRRRRRYFDDTCVLSCASVGKT